MKKILILLTSLLSVLISPFMIYADEERPIDILMQGKGGIYNVGDVIELPYTTTDGLNTSNSKFMVIGKDEDYAKSLTLMSIENIDIIDDCECFTIMDTDYADATSWLKDGTFSTNYEGCASFNDLIGFNGDTSGMIYSFEPLSKENITYADSKYDKFRAYLEGINQGGFANRIMTVNKEYQDGEDIKSLAVKYFLPSLQELGFDSELSTNDFTYSLFTDKNLFEVLDEKEIDTTKKFNMYTRDIDVDNHSLVAIDHNVVDYLVLEDYQTEAGRYALHGYGFCFVVTYDEDVTLNKNYAGQSVTLYSNNPSSYYVIMPKKVFVQSNATTKFNVIVKGDISGEETIKIDFAESVNLLGKNANALRPSIPLTISGNKTTISYLDMINKPATNTISIVAPEIQAGEWEVEFPISISLEN